MQGIIVKGIAGFYYVYTDSGILECKAKGIFRNRKIKPLVGDRVDVVMLDEKDMTGSIEDILPRKNVLIRPACANIDQAVIVFAISRPKPNLYLLDKFLVMMQVQEVQTVIVFNKIDEAEEVEMDALRERYRGAGAKLLFVSAKDGQGIEDLRGILGGRVSIFAGPSGVGKSTLTNCLMREDCMETGDVSRIGRGRQTTRHSQIFSISKGTYLMDTPGFTSFDLPELSKENLRYCFPEFSPYEGKCYFDGCVHLAEPDCAVKAALEEGKIAQGRYDSYAQMYAELAERERRKYS
ncbi:MAG: ribosome small subunit-dependent GTPase A [Lachnospiraceae bacterium]|jgi:ribosome biogenesis GTPase